MFLPIKHVYRKTHTHYLHVFIKICLFFTAYSLTFYCFCYFFRVFCSFFGIGFSPLLDVVLGKKVSLLHILHAPATPLISNFPKKVVFPFFHTFLYFQTIHCLEACGCYMRSVCTIPPSVLPEKFAIITHYIFFFSENTKN